MTQIQIINLKRYDSYAEVSYKMTFVLPAIYGTGATPIAGLSTIISSFPEGYSTEVIPVDGTVITYSKTSSINLAATLVQIQSALESFYNTIRTSLDAITLSPQDNIAGLSYNGTIWETATPIVVPSIQSLTNTELRATPVPVSGTFFQATQPVSFAEASVLFKGRACSFRTPGRAGTAGQKILSLHNTTASPVTITINKVFVDLIQTVIKAITVAPPIVRLWKVTVLPTNGTALAKNKIGGSTTSNDAVTVLGDASADGTGSGTTLTATLPAGAILTQQFAPRYITAVGYEEADRMEFLGGTKITLGALEGVVLFLDYTLATQNPVSDQWVAGVEWTES